MPYFNTLQEWYDRYVQPSIIPNRKGTLPLSTPPTMTITYVDKTLPTIQLDTTHINTSEKEHVATTTVVDGHNISLL
ncbi:hypothetical protein HPB48_003599 [Haemaphysalis longicornis]|uniref:Uncharacterized protein n=1 Tax=Haemaphysalis longicornis TaxID=44386 RepID=A0A9J6F720_HAELO|nr:hypothetical protein HPB48_003599 [Haemaphysalis longicornis]